MNKQRYSDWAKVRHYQRLYWIPILVLNKDHQTYL